MSDYSKLKELAEAASEGAWVQDAFEVVSDGIEDRRVARCSWLTDAQYIAAANPAVVLGLIAHLDLAVEARDLYMADKKQLAFALNDARAEAARLKAECEGLPKHAPSSEIIWCECGDGYPANSYGAGFMAANGGVCENCDAAEPELVKITCSLEFFENLRDSAAAEAEEHRQCMGSYRPHRQELLDAVVCQCDELIAGVSKGEQA
ncbi:hypothetical protein SAMN04490192_2899 [Pseudomonas lundensis]|uniref:hypothetical protein n=1 Tax=Pseudomonas lundensis TaxID=86185 RepID=UPI00088277C7|nr:hypothetical protein [Pseudomonas lundensis]SDQ72239.1 hypothetical protein SAMN04490192_2899 [Pseudomonas lundensis]